MAQTVITLLVEIDPELNERLVSAMERERRTKRAIVEIALTQYLAQPVPAADPVIDRPTKPIKKQNGQKA